MDIRHHIIAYNCNSDQIKVSPILDEISYKSLDHFRMTTGAAYVWVRTGNNAELKSFLKAEFIAAVFRDGVCPLAAYRAFMQIDQFRQAVPDDMPSMPYTFDPQF